MHYSTVSYNKNNYFEQQILHTYIVHYTIHIDTSYQVHWSRNKTKNGSENVKLSSNWFYICGEQRFPQVGVAVVAR